MLLGVELRLITLSFKEETGSCSDSAPRVGVKECKMENYARKVAFNFFLEDLFYQSLTFLNTSFPVSLIISTKHFIINI